MDRREEAQLYIGKVNLILHGPLYKVSEIPVLSLLLVTQVLRGAGCYEPCSHDCFWRLCPRGSTQPKGHMLPSRHFPALNWPVRAAVGRMGEAIWGYTF